MCYVRLDTFFIFCVFFFFKQKTAYEMRISDWSSDVCSSDLNTNASVEAVTHEPCEKASRDDTGEPAPMSVPGRIEGGSSVTQQRRAPGESTAERLEQQQLATLDLSGADCLVQRQRHRARRRVAVLVDGDDDAPHRTIGRTAGRGSVGQYVENRVGAGS